MALLLGLTPEGSLREELGYGLRVSARLAFAALLIAYIARPWRQLAGGGRWLLRHRRYFGLAAPLTTQCVLATLSPYSCSLTKCWKSLRLFLVAWHMYSSGLWR